MYFRQRDGNLLIETITMPLLPLASVILTTEHAVSPNQDIPKGEMDIFFRTESEFLPQGKTWEELTDVEKEAVRSKYRFDPFRPGCYQGITGIGEIL